MKKILLFVSCIFLLIGCTNSKKPEKEIDAKTESDSSTSNIISYGGEKSTLTQNVVGDIEDSYPIFKYELSQDLKSAIIKVWEKKDMWENEITSYEDNIYSSGQIAIILGDNAYDIYLIHSETENDLINYNFSQHYVSESPNSKEIMFANTLDHKKINPDEEITLFSTIEYKGNNPTALQDYSDFRKIDCDYGVVVTITFYDTENAPRNE